jgi:hypothetical protein
LQLSQTSYALEARLNGGIAHALCDKTDTNLTQFAVEFHRIVTHITNIIGYGLSMTDNKANETKDHDLKASMFNPTDYITLNHDGFALCTNPMADGGLEAIMVNTRLVGEGLRNFEGSIKRMVLSKLFSPKFGEVILTLGTFFSS